jgi:2-hydroxychromene-2-carboxylate isomerase
MAEVECFFDCSSPWTYFAVHSLLELRKEMGATISFRPHLVGGVFNAVNPSVHNSREKPVVPKAAYSKKDQQDWARFLGIPMHYRPTVFPVNSVKIMRGCCWLEGTDRLEPLMMAAFNAYWGDDLDMSKDDVLTEICKRAGVDPAAFFTAINEQPNKDRLRTNTDELIARGGFGSPTIFVGGDDMYFGNDRMPLIRDSVLRHRK